MPPLTATPFDPKKYIDRFHESQKGRSIAGLDDVFNDHRGIETRLVPASWGYVVYIAVIYAVCINVVKQCYYFAFGRFDITPASVESME